MVDPKQGDKHKEEEEVDNSDKDPPASLGLAAHFLSLIDFLVVDPVVPECVSFIDGSTL